MLVQAVKSITHRIKASGADLNYIGSITIDKDLMDTTNIIEGERIHIVNNNNGAAARKSYKRRYFNCLLFYEF